MLKNNRNVRIKKNMSDAEKKVAKICIVCCTFLVVAITAVAIFDGNSLVKKTSSDDAKTSATNENKPQSKMAVNTNDTKKENKTSNNTSKKETKVDLTNPSQPVKSGEVLMSYSYNTEPVYSITLDEYISDHAGIDIKANKGEEVKSILDGTVKKVYKDDNLGYSVIISHGDTLTSIYANLNEHTKVKKGDKVTKGQTVGYVGSSAVFEVGEDSHVHFGIKKDGKYKDPCYLYNK